MKAYGKELIIDLHNCDPQTFTRNKIKKYFVEVCKLIDMERAKLLYVRGLALKQAADNLLKYSHEERRVIRRILRSKNDSVGQISRSLNMDDKNVEKILTRFREDGK